MSKDTAIEVNIEEVETTTQATKEVTTTKQESKTQPSTVQTETIDKIPNKPSGIKQLFSKFVNFIKLLFNN
ncbi:MAG: hypothetical protein PHO23_00165 [Candidatus Pacebacteria bacterium]|nr:hypothetical protein [Candidatus Paceibacterota bacterium]